MGVAPVVGYHYGACNYGELKNVRKKSMILIGAFSVLMFAAGQMLARPLSLIFVSYDADLLEMTVHAFNIFSFSFLMSGFAIFGSSFFTALNNGGVSAAISFLRTLVFQTAAVLILPIIFGLEGIWWAVTAAEVFAVAVSAVFLAANDKRYHYLKDTKTEDSV